MRKGASDQRVRGGADLVINQMKQEQFFAFRYPAAAASASHTPCAGFSVQNEGASSAGGGPEKGTVDLSDDRHTFPVPNGSPPCLSATQRQSSDHFDPSRLFECNWEES